MNNQPVRSKRTGPLIAMSVIIFVAGFLLGRTANSPAVETIDQAVQQLTRSETPADFSLLTKTWNLIQERYVERPVDDQKLLEGAVSGLVSSLEDPYSFYLTPVDASNFENEINGKFEGIGAELGQREGQTVVIAPLPDTPAQRAGLKPGDTILAIDDENIDGQTLDQVVQKIRGKEGTEVSLRLAREDVDPFIVKITRARIQIKSVNLSFRDHAGSTIALLSISSFTQSTSAEFKNAVQTILLRQPAGIIFDLRNNPGGYLDAAVDVADAFLADGPILIEEYANGRRETLSAEPAAPLAQFNVVALVNGGSASAAEILAGALRDRLSTPLLGTKTFGKGSVQEIEDLPGGSTLKLTVAHWLTPNGTSIQPDGLKPDEEISEDETQFGADDKLVIRAIERLLTP